MALVPREVDPGVIVFFNVILEGEFSFDVFSVGRILGDKNCTLIPGEFKGDPCTRLHSTDPFDQSMAID
jgi:hypothetical protein